MNYKLNRKVATRMATAAGLAALAGGAQAQFAYNNADLLLVFYQNGAAQNLTVDLGQASTFTSASSPITISQFTTAQLSTVFSSLDAVTFAVMGGASGIGGAGGFSQNTVFLSDPASDPNTAPTPFNRHGSSTQSTYNGQIQAVGNGAVSFSANNPSTAVNTATAVSIDSTAASAYQTINGTSGNLHSTFSGNIENVTPTGFAAGSTPLRSDLIELTPGSGQGTDIGYFEFNPSGTVTFTPASVPEPGTMALCGVGALMGLASIYRKNRKA